MGGWVRPNAYVCLQGGWVGVAKCLRNHKNHQKKRGQIDLGERLQDFAICLRNEIHEKSIPGSRQKSHIGTWSDLKISF